MLEWRPATGRRTSNALIPNVEDKAVNAEDQITFCGEEPAYRRKQDTHTQRERHKEYISIQEMQQLQR